MQKTSGRKVWVWAVVLAASLSASGARFAQAAPSTGPGEPRPPIVDRSEFAWHDFHSGDVLEIQDSYVEAALRMELIRRATRTIEISQYLQTGDGPVGLPLASALRDAANRGVKIRYLTTGAIAGAEDLMSRFRHHLLQGPTREPVQCLYFNPGGAWSRFDSIHEKWLIVDGKWAVTGGRAYGFTYLHWLDDGFIARGALATDARAAFERVWGFAIRQQQPETTAAVPAEQPVPRFRHFLVPSQMGLRPEQESDKQVFLAWLDEPPKADAPVTGRARVIHFDMIQQRWMNHFPRSLPARAAQLSDPVIAALVERISRPQTRRVLISSMSLIEHPSLKAALIEAAGHGAEVRMFTNSKATDSELAPLGLNWVISLPDMLDLLAGGVRIDLFESRPQAHPWVYLHKKMAIVDDDVFIGSHNFHYPSSIYNDEADFEVEDAAFARLSRERLEAQIQLTARPADAAVLHADYYHGSRFVRGLKHWLGRVMFPLF